MLNSKARLSSILLLVIVIFSACIQTEGPDRTKRFAIRFDGGILGTEQVLGGDTLVINRILFHVPEFEAGTVDGQIIRSIRPIYIDYSDANLGFTITVAQEDLGFLEIEGFNSFLLAVDTVEVFQTDQNPLLVKDLRFFTIFLDMTWNNQSFEFRTQYARDLNFDYAPVNYEENKETMFFEFSADPYSWFVDTDADTLIDPTNLFNGRQIDQNVFRNLSLEVSANSVFE